MLTAPYGPDVRWAGSFPNDLARCSFSRSVDIRPLMKTIHHFEYKIHYFECKIHDFSDTFGIGELPEPVDLD